MDEKLEETWMDELERIVGDMETLDDRLEEIVLLMIFDSVESEVDKLTEEELEVPRRVLD